MAGGQDTLGLAPRLAKKGYQEAVGAAGLFLPEQVPLEGLWAK